MKLIVQIPCLNEEATLPATLQDIPREIAGIDTVEILVVDDGCTDRTVEVAQEMGVEHVLSFPGNRGLGHAFAAGIDRCLSLGADIIVNTDGDNQYCGADIPKLVEPILAHRADIVIGDREPDKIAHFSWLKKKLQKLGSGVVSWLAGTNVPDVASGFRAYSREAAMQLICSTDFDHTVDHVIQAGRRRIITRCVPIRTNERLRESRLFSNIWVFVTRSLGIMIRVYSSYRAMRIFSTVGVITASLGFLIGLRFIYIFFFEPASRDLHIQSLILAAILLIAGFQMILTGIVADLINSNRSVLEDLSYRLRRLEDQKLPRSEGPRNE
ncbi:MAG: glycosyltransferase family 2 protein [Pirellulales bacterium]|nr:glycosyltransferase family 2 protein [Pirellulales bacterium]